MGSLTVMTLKHILVIGVWIIQLKQLTWDKVIEKANNECSYFKSYCLIYASGNGSAGKLYNIYSICLPLLPKVEQYLWLRMHIYILKQKINKYLFF